MQEIENSQTMGSLYAYINKFTRKDDFILQKFKMETMLKSRALWSHIDGSNVKPLENNIVTYWIKFEVATKKDYILCPFKKNL
jgi:hypothetical protein